MFKKLLKKSLLVLNTVAITSSLMATTVAAQETTEIDELSI